MNRLATNLTNGIVKIDTEITQEFIDEVCKRLSENKQVRRTLPDHGRLHIDRKLPFLCVYRRPVKIPDYGTDQLVIGEASYLLASSAPRHKLRISSLVKAIVTTLSNTPGAFLIIEIWSKESPVPIIDPDLGRTAPSFRIFSPPNRIPAEAVESLKNALMRITVSKNKGEVTIVYTKRQWPEGLSSILSTRDLIKFNCFLIGLEISPIYRNPGTNEIFPLVLKKIHRGVSGAFKQAAYEFAHKRTTVRPANYKSLGRRAVVKAVWEVDQRLASISNELDFLLLVTPVNIEQSWNKFKSCRFECEPAFYYRPIPVDPSVLKRKLYTIPFDRIEDPALASIFHKKLVELEMKLSMLRDRYTKNFFYGSMQLYGEINDKLTELAERILLQISPKSREISGSHEINASEFAALARDEINFYREFAPGIKSKVFIRDDIIGLMVSRGNLFIGKRVKIPESRAEALIQHEVGTHVLTYINGKDQPFQQLYCGLSGCDELQEGLAVLSEYLVGGLSAPRLRLLAGRVLATRMLIDGASFIETFRELHFRLGFSERTAYVITSRIFRSGGFTKDAVYLRGLVNLIIYLRNGGELAPLMVGKISIEDVPIIKELKLRKILKPSLLKPRYINSPQSISRLNDLKNGKLIYNLI
jgi:uncharacterized protein (TIGR02421 family)